VTGPSNSPALAETPGPAQIGSARGSDDCRAGVVVVGNYRSGTSVAARIVNLIGMPITDPADLVPPGRANPTGFWESSLMNRHNEWLLRTAGGSWCLPPAKDSFQRILVREEWLNVSRALFRHVHRTSRWVWKEPRLCVTLPWWRRALPEISTGILMLRHPAECALSSNKFFGIDVFWGLAIWERQLRQALAGLVGLRVLVSTLDSLRAAPLAWCHEVLSLLPGGGPRPPPHWPAAVHQLLRQESRRTDCTPAIRLPEGVSELWAQLNELCGVHRGFAEVQVGLESAWAAEVLSRRRHAIAQSERFQTW
jgi:hypothetical protein